MSKKATFQLANYIFDDVSISIDKKIDMIKGIDVSFEPSGEFFPAQKLFKLNLIFSASAMTDENPPFIRIGCVGDFLLKRSTPSKKYQPSSTEMQLP
ncbi:hypothetical protein [Flavobacterium sp.]|uniref:hypothetical protein n=1 Tax=Flavobacterium sp. TaxID=239 RepID=UPI0025C36D2B|nr:hypothetical protein [Flavobacterium sp.]